MNGLMDEQDLLSLRQRLLLRRESRYRSKNVGFKRAILSEEDGSLKRQGEKIKVELFV